MEKYFCYYFFCEENEKQSNHNDDDMCGRQAYAVIKYEGAT